MSHLESNLIMLLLEMTRAGERYQAGETTEMGPAAEREGGRATEILGIPLGNLI